MHGNPLIYIFYLFNYYLGSDLQPTSTMLQPRSLSNDPRFIHSINRNSHASMRFVEVYRSYILPVVTRGNHIWKYMKEGLEWNKVYFQSWATKRQHINHN